MPGLSVCSIAARVHAAVARAARTPGTARRRAACRPGPTPCGRGPASAGPGPTRSSPPRSARAGRSAAGTAGNSRGRPARRPRAASASDAISVASSGRACASSVGSSQAAARPGRSSRARTRAAGRCGSGWFGHRSAAPGRNRAAQGGGVLAQRRRARVELERRAVEAHRVDDGPRDHAVGQRHRPHQLQVLRPADRPAPRRSR